MPQHDPRQTDLEDAIAKAKASARERERLRIAASPSAVASLERRSRAGALTTTTRSHLVTQISAFTDKEQAKRKRRNAAAGNYNGPTPERLAKALDGTSSAVVIKGVGGGTEVRNYTIRSTLEAHRGPLKERLYAVGARFLKDWDAAEVGGPRLAASYDGIAVQAFGPRHGGVHDAAREAKARMMLLASQIGTDAWALLTGLVAQVQDARLGRSPSLAEIGHWLAGYKAGSDQARAAGLGALIAVLWFVEGFYAREDALNRGDASTAAEIQARLQIRRERIAREKERRERATLIGG